MMRFYLFVAALLFATGILIGAGFWGGMEGDAVQVIATTIAGIGAASAAGVGFLALSSWKRKAQFEWVDALLVERISWVRNIEIFCLEEPEGMTPSLRLWQAKGEYFIFEDGIFLDDTLNALQQLGVSINEQEFLAHINSWTDAVDDLYKKIIDVNRDEKIPLRMYSFKEVWVEAMRRNAYVRYLEKIRHQVRLAL